MKRASPTTTDTTTAKESQPETAVQLSKKQKKQLADAKQKEDDLKRITDANVSDIIYLEGIRSFTSPPERKPFLQIDLGSSDASVGLAVDLHVEVFQISHHIPTGHLVVGLLLTCGIIPIFHQKC